MMTEEEREIRDRKEKMEKEKEDFYKRRKNGKEGRNVYVTI